MRETDTLSPYHRAMRRTVAAISMLHLTVAAAEGVCTRWSEPAKVGDLNVKTIMEASGIAISRTAQRLYHINDGNLPFFHVTDMQGGATQSVQIAGFTPLDIEAVALGPCGNSSCLYIADIGDNAVRRDSVQIALVKEARAYGAEAIPDKLITARYPDGPHDAEGIAIHPSGDLFLATKSRFDQLPAPSQLFRLSAAQLAADGEHTFELVGAIPVARLSEQLGDSPRRVVTAMDIAPDGNRFMLLTYDAAIEFGVDLQHGLPGAWTAGKTHHAFAVAPLIQTEAIAYDRDGLSILYSTESIRGSAAPLMQQTCQD
jgi:hypothetical protein